MKKTAITERLAGLGGAKWAVHLLARSLAEQGREIIELTIGEPDIGTPPELIAAATDAMQRGRTTYSDGRGESNLRAALSDCYSGKTGRSIAQDQILCFPGTQTALYAVMFGVAETGDEVLVGDPLYATYEGVIRATGATLTPVPLSAARGFRISAADIESRLNEQTSAILLTNPHNPTGAILTEEDLVEIGRLAVEHDFWIISDEVYEELIFDGQRFVSALAFPEFADRVIAVSSISKSHAAPGFRSGWSVSSAAFAETLLPLSETMLFGNQPFIADMTETALREGSSVARGMASRYAARAERLAARLNAESPLNVHPPQAGMFAVIDVSATGLDGKAYAMDLLENYGVAVMPGGSFGTTMNNWVRVALTVDDEPFDTACQRMIDHSQAMLSEVA